MIYEYWMVLRLSSRWIVSASTERCLTVQVVQFCGQAQQAGNVPAQVGNRTFGHGIPHRVGATQFKSLQVWTIFWLAPCDRTAPHHNRLCVFVVPFLFLTTGHEDSENHKRR